MVTLPILELLYEVIKYSDIGFQYLISGRLKWINFIDRTRISWGTEEVLTNDLVRINLDEYRKNIGTPKLRI